MTAGMTAGMTPDQLAAAQLQAAQLQAAQIQAAQLQAAQIQAAQIQAAAEKVKAAGLSAARLARDPVNMAAIRNWTDAMGDTNPLYTDADFAERSSHGRLVAPPAMVQVWTMPGLMAQKRNDGHPADAGGDPLGQMMGVLDEAGFTAVVATNCDQTYFRYLRHGELLSMRAELTDVTGPKRTALGDGWFVTTRNVWYSGDEPVAEMDWRVLKFRPGIAVPATPAPAPQTTVIRPAISPDTEFFWAGTRAGELRIQRCGECGALRHPPGPACLSCGASRNQGYQVATGTGTVYSYVVHHHPPVPGKELPIVVALVELDEGVRLVAELTGIKPDDVRIGLPVRTSFIRIDDDLVLPGWRPDDRAGAGVLPELTIQVTPTVVVSTAIATRDFYQVHHDRDFAIATGSKDIFLNILTTTGLVQRYVTDWAGPEVVVRGVSIRLGVPCYAGDILTFSGQVRESSGAGQVIAVTGSCGLGNHVTGTVRLRRVP
jgi:uncharacterized OB-fold protein/acyl dehydratase